MSVFSAVSAECPSYNERDKASWAFHVILRPHGSMAAREDGSYCQVVGLCCHAICNLCSVGISVDRRSTQRPYFSNPFIGTPIITKSRLSIGGANWCIFCYLLRICRNEKSRASNLIFRQVERSAFNMQFSRGMIRRSSLKQHISLPFQVIHQYFTVIL